MAIKNTISHLRNSLLGERHRLYPVAPERLWWGGTTPFDYDPDLSRLGDRPPLEQLADALGTDKGTVGKGHLYTRVYERLIEDITSIRRGAPISVCEIGVACGASLKMWSHYLPTAKIVGIDIREECAELCKTWPNIEIQIGDPRKLERPPAQFDLIVDDASHISEDIKENFDHCFAWLRNGGYYVVEDVSCVGDKAYAQSLIDRFGMQGLKNDRSTFTQMVDTLMLEIDSHSNLVDHIEYHSSMLVIQKGSGN